MYFPVPSQQSPTSKKMSNEQQDTVVYEMFIPFLYRGKDKESTERRVFWVFKQLNWGYISEVRVFGFDDDTKKNVTARISFTSLNAKASDLITQLDAGETAQVHYEQGKPWFWNVVKYTRRAPTAPKKPVEPQVTFKIKVKPTTARPQTPPMSPPVETAPKNKFKVLQVDSDSESEKREKRE